MTDREFWIMVRRALLMFVEAIEKRYKLEPRGCSQIVKPGPTDTLTVRNGG